MLIFKSYNNDKKDWDLFLKTRNFYDVRHSFNYLKYLKEINKNDIIKPYLIYRNIENSENLIGQLILKIKKFFFINIIYIYCGPTNLENFFDEFSPSTIIKNLNISKGIYYIRLKTFLPDKEIILDNIKKNNWKRLISTEENIILDLKKDVTYLKKSLSRNWRHNFYRSKKKKLVTKILLPNDYNKIYSLYQEMCKIKKIEIPFSKNAFQKFCNIFNNDMLTIGAYYNGVLVSIRSVVLFNKKALDIFAATSLSGRSLYASYRLLWEIILLCKRRKQQILDLNGLDKLNNLGVYNFKIGIGGSVYKPLGVLEFCNFQLLLSFSNIILKFINKIKKR